jgi:nitrogen fixation protein FixH
VLVADPSDDAFETVRAVLTRAGATPVLTDEVTDLLRRIAEVDADAPLNLKIVADAVALCRLEEKLKDNASGMEGDAAIAGLLTETGRESALALLGTKISNS